MAATKHTQSRTVSHVELTQLSGVLFVGSLFAALGYVAPPLIEFALPHLRSQVRHANVTGEVHQTELALVDVTHSEDANDSRLS